MKYQQCPKCKRPINWDMDVLNICICEHLPNTDQPAAAEDDKEYREWVEKEMKSMANTARMWSDEIEHNLSSGKWDAIEHKEIIEAAQTRSGNYTRLIADIKKGMEQPSTNTWIDADMVEFGEWLGTNYYHIYKEDSFHWQHCVSSDETEYTTSHLLTAWQQQKKGGGK